MLRDASRTQTDAEFPPRQADGTINPKDAAALKRVPMHLLPQVGVVYGAMACRDGAIKYGPYNWRERSISLVQYVGAMQRHLSSLLDGEDNASDSELPHLAHVIATAAILLDAKQAGALIDDRPKRSGNTAALIASLNAGLAAKAEVAK
ncbi:MAG TPA: dATP/dGTP diphosphohydrolase domain-containing protein [Polyangiaceae bacterium]